MAPNARQTEVRNAVLEVLAACMRVSGRDLPDVPERGGLIDGIEGFDSLMAVEATVALESRLGIDIPGDCVFLAAEDGKPRARTLQEVVDAVAAINPKRSKR